MRRGYTASSLRRGDIHGLFRGPPRVKSSIKARNAALDGLRGYAALTVALGHCVLTYVGLDIWRLNLLSGHDAVALDWAKRSLFVLFPQDAAVMVFFVLSGHVLWESFSKHGRPAVRLFLDYAVSRFFRLYPAVWASLLFFAALAGSWRPPASASDLVQNALLLSHNVDGVLWSLQVEVCCSLLIFLVWAVCGSSTRRLIFVMVVIFIYGQSHRIHQHPVSYEQATFVLAFCFGATISSLPNVLRVDGRLAIIGLIGLATSSVVFGHTAHAREGEVLGAWMIVSYVGATQPAFTTNRMAQFLGKVSYPFYLTHLIGIALAEPLVARTASGLLPKIVGLAIVSIAITLPIAWLIHAGVEMPAMRLRSKWRGVRVRNSQGAIAAR